MEVKLLVRWSFMGNPGSAGLIKGTIYVYKKWSLLSRRSFPRRNVETTVQRAPGCLSDRYGRALNHCFR